MKLPKHGQQTKAPLNRETLESHIRHNQGKPSTRPGFLTNNDLKGQGSAYLSWTQQSRRNALKGDYLDEPEDTELKRIVINSTKEPRV